MERETENTSSDWMIMVLIILTILVFIYILMSTLQPSPSIVKQIDKEEITVIEGFDGREFMLARDGVPIPSQDYVQLAGQWMRAALSVGYTLKKPISLGEKEVSAIHVAKTFFIYDCRIVYDASKQCFVITILMELPPIQIVIDEAYSSHYPLLNPYLHVVEFVYHWTPSKQAPMMSDQLRLKTFNVFTVDWEMNRYHRMFLDIKGSPLFRIGLPEPIHFTKEQLHQFLHDMDLFQTIPVMSDSASPFTLAPISTDEHPMTTKIV